jgi:hypothetical protein
MVARQPIFEQIVDHGVKPFLRRIPRLYQIEVNLHLIDRADRRFRRRKTFSFAKPLAGKYEGRSQLWVLFSPWGRSRGLVRRRLCEGGSATLPALQATPSIFFSK